MQDVLKTRFQEVSGGRILDVATNNGQFIHRIVESFKDYREIIGIDIDEISLAKAKELSHVNKYRNIGFLCMNSENMDFLDNCFDVVCISNSLHHLENIDKTLYEMKRVLKKGGYFVIAEMFSDTKRQSQKSHVLFHHLIAKIDSLTGIYHGQTFKKYEIIKISKNLDFPKTKILEQDIESDNPHDESVIGKIIEFIDTTLLRVKNHSDYPKLLNEGNVIKSHIYKNGWESSPQLITICT